MRCLRCNHARAMPRGESMFRLCADCAFIIAPATTTAWLKLQHYRYPELRLTPAQQASAERVAADERAWGIA